MGRPWAYPAVYDLVRRLRTRTGIAFEPTPLPPHLRDLAAASRGRDGEREGASRPCLDHHDDRHVWSPHRRGRPPHAGSGGLVHRAGGAAVTALAKRAAGDRAGLLETVDGRGATGIPGRGARFRRPRTRCWVSRTALCPTVTIRFPMHGLCNGHRLRWRAPRPAAAGRVPRRSGTAAAGPVEVRPLHRRRLPLRHCRTRLVHQAS